MYVNLHAREPGDPTIARRVDHWAGRSGDARGGNPEMNDGGKSDGPVVPAKPLNKAASAVAEVVEERGLAKGNTASTARSGHRAGSGVSHALDRVRQVAREDKETRFTLLPPRQSSTSSTTDRRPAGTCAHARKTQLLCPAPDP
jgi:hypothetical protein